MAGKSQLDGAASRTYESCYGDNCDAPARKAMVISSLSEEGVDSHIVPVCKSCEKKATKNAVKKGLPMPRSQRLTKKMAQDFRAMNGDTKPINPHKANKERLEGKRPVNSNRKHLVGQAPESMTKAWTIKINQLDPGRPAKERAVPRAFSGDFEKNNALVEAYQARNLEVAKRRRSPQQRKEIIEEARKGLYKDLE